MILAIHAVGNAHPFSNRVKPSTLCNLKADEFIKGHSDIQKDKVAFVPTVGMAVPILIGPGISDPNQVLVFDQI